MYRCTDVYMYRCIYLYLHIHNICICIHVHHSLYVYMYPPTLGGVLDGFSNGKDENPFLFFLRGLGGGGGILCPFPSRPPPPRQPFQPTPTPSPASHQENFQNNNVCFWGEGLGGGPRQPRLVAPTDFLCAVLAA